MADKKAKVVVSSGLGGRLEVGRWGNRRTSEIGAQNQIEKRAQYMIIPFGCEDGRVCSTSSFVWFVNDSIILT